MQCQKAVAAKVVVNQRLKTLRVMFTFDMHHPVTVHNSAFITGDICGLEHEHAAEFVHSAIVKHAAELSADRVYMHFAPSTLFLDMPAVVDL